jgi:hypothetical protein
MTCQNLLKEKCIEDEKLFSSFLNRLFNTLNWTITEFSVSIRDMREQSDPHQVPCSSIKFLRIICPYMHYHSVITLLRRFHAIDIFSLANRISELIYLALLCHDFWYFKKIFFFSSFSFLTSEGLGRIGCMLL